MQYWLTMYNRFHMCNIEAAGKSESSCTECDEQFMAFKMHMNLDSELHNSTHS